MPDITFHSKQRHIKVLLNRVGTYASVSRPDGTATENKYGKISDQDVSYSPVGEFLSYRLFPSNEERANEQRVQGGRVDSEQPRIVVPKDADVQEDDHVTYDDTGREYVLDEKIPRKSHNEFRATLVTE